MSDFNVEVVRVTNVQKHPDADTLSIATANGCPVIFRTGDYAEGDLAVHIPVDAIVPENERFAFLGVHRRITAKRLRGVFSMGLLTPAEPNWTEGQNVQSELGIEKYEPALHLHTTGENERDPGLMPLYTDIEGLRRWSNVLEPGEDVVLTEKIHGANFRAVHDGTRLWVGSRTCIKRRDDRSIWWRAALQENLEEKLATCPNVAFYGEVYGYVQDLRYGAKQGEVSLRFFDAYDCKSKRYVSVNSFDALCGALEVKQGPRLYAGPWQPALAETHSIGQSTLATHCREGFVVRPWFEREHPRLGRVILKMVGQDYLLRKSA